MNILKVIFTNTNTFVHDFNHKLKENKLECAVQGIVNFHQNFDTEKEILHYILHIRNISLWHKCISEVNYLLKEHFYVH